MKSWHRYEWLKIRWKKVTRKTILCLFRPKKPLLVLAMSRFSWVLKPMSPWPIASRVRKVKKDWPNQDRSLVLLLTERWKNWCGWFKWKPQEYSPIVEDVGCLFTHPLQYQYQDKARAKPLRVQFPIPMKLMEPTPCVKWAKQQMSRMSKWAD